MLKRNGGFSLVELMAACAIIGIIVAIAIPYYVSYKRAACDRVAQEDLANIAASWEKYINDDSNTKHKPPQDLKDLAGEFYGWGGTSTKCDVRFYLDHSTLTVYAASYKGSHPRGPGSRYMFMMKMPAGLTPSSAKLDTGPGLFWSILGSIGSLLEPAPAYAANDKSNGSNSSNSNASQTQSQTQTQTQNQTGNQGNTASNHQDRNTDGNQQGQGNANGNAWGQGNGNNGNGNDNSGNSGSSGQGDSGSTGDSSSNSTPADTGSAGSGGSDSGTSAGTSGGSDSGTSASGGGDSGGSSAGTSGGSDTGTSASAGGGTSGGNSADTASTEGAALSGSGSIGLVSTTDLDSAWKAYPFGVGPAVSAFDKDGNYVER